MSILLPAPIASYFASDRTDGVSVANAFTEDAIVVDEGRPHTGRDGIRQWKSATSGKYSYLAEPYKMTGEGDQITVTAHLTGNFPGSPLDLRYAFTLQGDLIARLEITL